MEYPKDPTVLPSAQRHTETYNADQGRVFTDGDVISIQIPPTTNSYLTKDAQLHFDFNMTYQEGTDQNYQEIANNLSFDNVGVTFTAGNNQLVFTGGVTGTYAIPADTYSNYQEVCEIFNEANPTCPIHLYYDDLGDNKVKMVYGFLVQQGINDTFEWSVNGVTRTPITLVPDVYTWEEDWSNYPIIDLETYLNSMLGDIKLGYDPTLNIFVFAGLDPFTITTKSNGFMQLLGFTSDTQNDRVAFYNSQYQRYEIYTTLAAPSQNKPLISMLNNTCAGLLQFSTVAPTVFSYFNSNKLIQSATGAAVVPITAATDCTPKDFFKNIIYTESTSADTANPPTYPNIYRPYPTLDVNGPYGFFESLEVYDYLGNTLLEKVPRHDLLTAIWSDLESSTETQDTIIRPRYIDDDLLTITKPSCSFLVSGNPNSLFAQSPITNDLTSTDPVTEENVKAATLSIPTLSCGINLYSFLGKLSEKFVPLHNGFTVKFIINRRENVIAFNTEQPNNRISYVATPASGPKLSNNTDMKPFVKTYTFSNVYLRGDIVTVPPELDSRIDKIVFSKGYKVQMGVPQNRAQRVNTEVKSLTSLIVVQQPASTHNGSMRYSAFIRNYCKGAKLLFNKAVVSSVKNFTEAYRNFRNVFGCTWDEYVRRSNWEVDFPSSNAAWMQTRMTDKASLSNLEFSDKFFQDVSVPLGRLPRYLLAFDTRLPGYTPMAVCGIDTRKQLLEIQLETSTDTKQSAAVTMISEFDTFIEIKPSESSAVSF